MMNQQNTSRSNCRTSSSLVLGVAAAQSLPCCAAYYYILTARFPQLARGGLITPHRSAGRGEIFRRK